MNLMVCGCGALGSRIALELAHYEWREISLIDNDIVEGQNIPTSVYGIHDIGRKKVQVLAEKIYEMYEVDVIALHQDMTPVTSCNRNTVIVDAFDNAAARRMTRGFSNVVHCGVSHDLLGAVIWDDAYTLPEDDPGENRICTNQLGHQILQQTASLAVTIIVRFLNAGEKSSMLVNGLRLISFI